MRAANPSNAVSGFRCTGIYPFIQNVITETAFAPSNVSDGPVEQAPPIPVQNKPQQHEDTTPGSLVRQYCNRPSTSSLSVNELLPTPKMTRNPMKCRLSLNEKATVYIGSLFRTDGKNIS
jgi:hypothetical protein